MNRFFRSALFPLFVIVLLVYLASQTLIPHSKSPVKTTYSQFLTLAQQGKVANVVFNPGKRQINFTLSEAGRQEGQRPLPGRPVGAADPAPC